MEDEVGVGSVEWQVSNLIDHEYRGPGVGTHLAAESAELVGGAKVTDHIVEVGEVDRVPGPHLAASLEQLVKRADSEQVGYLDFLDLIIEEELGIRDGRRFRAALRLSKLPHHKTIDEFEFSFQPDLDVRKVKDLASLSFIDTKSNVALLGPPGVGKTHLAVGDYPALAVLGQQF